jgi:hypothetical protein
MTNYDCKSLCHFTEIINLPKIGEFYKCFIFEELFFSVNQMTMCKIFAKINHVQFELKDFMDLLNRDKIPDPF